MTHLVHDDLPHPLLCQSIPKIALMERNHYWFSVADTIAILSAEKKTFRCWAEKKALQTPLLRILSLDLSMFKIQSEFVFVCI